MKELWKLVIIWWIKVILFDNIFAFMISAAWAQSNLLANFKNVKVIYIKIFLSVCSVFIVIIVSLSHHELVPFVYVYGMFVCLSLQSCSKPYTCSWHDKLIILSRLYNGTTSIVLALSKFWLRSFCLWSGH